MTTREGRELEFEFEPLDVAGNPADIDAVELLIQDNDGAEVVYQTDSDPEIVVAEGVYTYATAELAAGIYTWQWGAIKGGVMVDNDEGRVVVKERLKKAES